LCLSLAVMVQEQIVICEKKDAILRSWQDAATPFLATTYRDRKKIRSPNCWNSPGVSRRQYLAMFVFCNSSLLRRPCIVARIHQITLSSTMALVECHLRLCCGETVQSPRISSGRGNLASTAGPFVLDQLCPLAVFYESAFSV